MHNHFSMRTNTIAGMFIRNVVHPFLCELVLGRCIIDAFHNAGRVSKNSHEM